MVAAPGGAAGGEAAGEEEQSEFDVILTGAGDKKIQVIGRSGRSRASG